ncbi:TonB-dependent receptor plug domain-containing protein [Sphingomonas lycopersici]|uniref:TonB-dependent receptor n=1 Tax=Sphingomonas lycopersici TaxID=2951807 RepID=A0AA41ZD29_9SPHN|nr:TonB-dependent receptor [Sphingomonas lycopersici]MCW6536926.1 TonB-dependent receptor [Sphingomonas lycopersici]
MEFRNGVASMALAAMVVCASGTAVAQSAPVLRYDLPGQDLAATLRAIARASGRQVIIATRGVEGKVAPALHGSFSADDAIRLVTGPSGVPVRFTPNAALVGEPETKDDPRAAGGDIAGEVTVTGTRIRSAAVVSPVTTLTTREALRDGQASTTAMIASVAQNFGGGQNPGVGSGVPNQFNETGGSSFNLRGLGSDATLTLIDGHRIAYGGSTQSVDVSSIPFLAIDRMEIVPDGSSALYGSDAVAGVANIILKNHFSGLEAAASIGVPTSGGGLSQQYGVIAGTTWRSGNVFAAYEYGYSEELSTSDRPLFRAVAPGLSLYPELEHHNLLVKARQEIASGISFEVEGFYNRRTSVRYGSYDLTGNYRVDGQRVSSADTSFAIIPTLRLDLGASWSVAVSGSYAQDHSDFLNLQFFSGSPSPYATCYCNASTGAEVNAEGPLFSLPGGEARLAIGAGLRSVHFEKPISAIDVSQRNYFAYSELALPLIAPAQGISGIAALNLNLAARFESYPSVGKVVTPRVGLIYSPVQGVSLKGTWGESFRAPTLYQEYVAQNLYLYPANLLGATGAPPSAAALLLIGGNRSLKPERAKTLSATLELRPAALPGAHLEVTYFQVRYRDRIVTPITYLTQALSNPYYGVYVTNAPTPAQQATVMAQAPAVNITGVPYDPANVVAIVLNNNVNAERQFARGVDISAGYRFAIGRATNIELLANASYLDSDQFVSAGQPREQLAGTLYHPPHFRGRAGVRVDGTNFSSSAFVNRIGGVMDTRNAPATMVRGMTTVDLAVTFHPQGSALRGLEATLSVENIGNVAPQVMTPAIIGDSPFDSTNYSPIGRRIGVTLIKRW